MTTLDIMMAFIVVFIVGIGAVQVLAIIMSPSPKPKETKPKPMTVWVVASHLGVDSVWTTEEGAANEAREKTGTCLYGYSERVVLAKVLSHGPDKDMT